MTVLLLSDERFDAHAPPRPHPERPERLIAVRRALAGRTLAGARAANLDEIERVHRRDYVRGLSAQLAAGSGWLDADTYYSAESWEAAIRACGAAIDATAAVLEGAASAALALVRPPGHHAEADRAMGFCLLNNVAVAAAAARAAGAERVAIVDWDVHHGNGTQHIFEADPGVLFASIHQFPFYPGTGAPTEIGVGAGEGATVNVGLPAGCGDAEYLYVLQAVIEPTLRAYRPDLILVSAGFDAAAPDPLASMRVTTAGFGRMTQRLRDLAVDVCGGRLAFALEGGYDLRGLSDAVRAVTDVLDGVATPVVPGGPEKPSELAQAAVFATLQAHRGAKNRWVPSHGQPGQTFDPVR